MALLAVAVGFRKTSCGASALGRITVCPCDVVFCFGVAGLPEGVLELCSRATRTLLGSARGCTASQHVKN